MIPARSFGVLDATCTNQLGIRTVPIGFNIYHSHSAREYVVIEDVKKMLELVENIIRYFLNSCQGKGENNDEKISKKANKPLNPFVPLVLMVLACAIYPIL